MSYGDILCEPVEYQRMQRILDKNPASAAIVAVKEVDDPWQGAAVYEIGGQITRIVEKTPQGNATCPLKTRCQICRFEHGKPRECPAPRPNRFETVLLGS